jgi:short-subunit dehydrogenase
MELKNSENVAVITGASSGIGEELALRLAKEGTHVVLVARSVEKLSALAKSIRTEGGRATVISVDLSKDGSADKLFEEIQKKNLNVVTLINNAGFGYWGSFEEQSDQQLRDMVRVNVMALTELTHRFLPTLLANRGTILNIASTVGFQPTPYMAAYGATKAYVLSFSEALWGEYRQKGLHVVAVCPGPVATPFIDALDPGVRDTKIFRSVLTVEQVVDAAMRALGSKGSTHIVGYRNWFLAQTPRFAPRAFTAWISARFLSPKTGAKTIRDIA